MIASKSVPNMHFNVVILILKILIMPKAYILRATNDKSAYVFQIAKSKFVAVKLFSSLMIIQPLFSFIFLIKFPLKLGKGKFDFSN